MSNDALVLLKEDHKEILRLLRAFHSTAADAHEARAELVTRLVHALTVHSYLEDEVLLPRLREIAAGPEVLESYRDHRTLDALCEELAELAVDDPRLARDVTALDESVHAHFEEEERDWFPQVRAHVGRKELQEIGVRLLAVKETAPRPPTDRVGDAADG